jgi:hypothetical protein
MKIDVKYFDYSKFSEMLNQYKSDPKKYVSPHEVAYQEFFTPKSEEHNIIGEFTHNDLEFIMVENDIIWKTNSIYMSMKSFRYKCDLFSKMFGDSYLATNIFDDIYIIIDRNDKLNSLGIK